MNATVEAVRPGGLYMLAVPFDNSFAQEAAWYTRMERDRAMSLRLNGRTVAGLVVTCWPFPVEKCMRLAFKPDARQPVRDKSTPVAKAQPVRPSAIELYPNLGRLALGRVPHP